MKTTVKRLLEKVDLLNRARQMRNSCRRLRRRIRQPSNPSDRTIIARYFGQTAEPKLHVGCAGHVIEGWLNTDYDSRIPTVVHLDIKHRFPFKEEVFDYVFSEHVIEHMPYDDGVKVLSECWRVLKPSGKIRISTPDLAFLAELTKPDKTDLQRAYIKWAANTFLPGAPDDNEVFVINNFMRNWGHTFIYDERTLGGALESVGFRAIQRFDQHQSYDAALQNLEDDAHVPPDFLRLESFSLEGTK